MPKRLIYPIALALLGLLFGLAPFQSVHADTGPKPTMEFTFVQGIPGQQLTIASGTLYECRQADCQDAAPLARLGPQHFGCDENGCNALAYGFSQYHRLEIQFSDGSTRRSNIFQTAGFDSIYIVTIRPDDLLVEAQFNPVNLLPTTYLPLDVLLTCGCLLALLVIIVVAVILIVRRRARKK